MTFSATDISSRPKVFLTILQNSHESTCARVSHLIKLKPSGLQFNQTQTPAQVFSSEYCVIFKNAYFAFVP